MTFPSAIPSFAVDAKTNLSWEKLSPIPDNEGFAGSFAGVHDKVLLVAGGANFSGKRPWEGGVKTWYDSVVALEKPSAKWKNGFKLPRPLGYGVSISCPDGVVCIGGSDAQRHYADVFVLSWAHGTIRVASLPSLPQPCANMCGALVAETIYVAGGIDKSDATNAMNTFWALNLTKPLLGWQKLQSWPGPGRIFATAGACGESFYLFGGAALKAGPDGKPLREWLRDAYRFIPGKGWTRIADLPRIAVAAPSPAPLLGKDQLLVLGGDDGAQVSVAPTQHVGFPRDVLAYSAEQNTWSTLGQMPFALVTTPAVVWNGRIIIPGGEMRPGIRSTEVWSTKP